MKDQHKKIKGYRDLSQSEIDLMNEIKAHAEKTSVLVEKIKSLRFDDNTGILTEDQIVESIRCIGLAKDNLQTGGMWLVRSVALPESF